jgi:hypothetical protein
MLPLEMVYAFDPVPPPPTETHLDEDGEVNNETGDSPVSDRWPQAVSLPCSTFAMLPKQCVKWIMGLGFRKPFS